MDIHLRILDKAELALVRRVADIVWPITFQEILSPEQMAYMMEMMYAAEVMEREYDEGVSFCGVFDEEKPIGYLAWGRSDSAPDTAKLHKCYLLPEYQGKGIGSMMLNKAKVYAKEAGFAKLRLNVNRNNAKAIKAYVRNGFQTVETVDRAIGHGFFMNDYVMEAEI
ncbi:MAG: GNAT family N-acetyltransferase [Lentisphaerae bacterium]|nr:GNAT family N-acetyltransferase [Lentisphaerota bacterium]OQC12928.1 MAG: Protease synthase and sporulation negative regulatory protein PAI 1 [Lentisphaerae bacterium ADurb.Bin082]